MCTRVRWGQTGMNSQKNSTEMAAGGQCSVGCCLPDGLPPDTTGQPGPRCSSSQILMARPSPICYANIPAFSNSFFFSFAYLLPACHCLGPGFPQTSVHGSPCLWDPLMMGKEWMMCPGDTEMDRCVIGAVIGRGNINNRVPDPFYTTGPPNFSSAC